MYVTEVNYLVILFYGWKREDFGWSDFQATYLTGLSSMNARGGRDLTNCFEFCAPLP